MQNLLLATRDRRLSDRLVASMEGMASVRRCAPDVPAVGQAMQHARPGVVLLDMDAAEGVAGEDAKALAALFAADGASVVLALGDEDAAVAALTAIRAGARAFLARDSEPAILRESLTPYLGTVPQREQSLEGALTSVLGGQANEGESLLAINYALARAALGHDVLLVDCNLPSSEAPAALDLDLRYTLRDAIADMPRLDRMLLSSALPAHLATGLHVLPLALAGEDVNDLSPSVFLALLLKLRGMFGEIVLNVGGIRHPALITEMVRPATTLLLVTTQKFTSLKACKELLGQLVLDPDMLSRTTLIVDDYHDDIALTEAQIATASGIARSARLPAARTALVNALNRGKPLMLSEKRHPYVRALQKLAADAPGTKAVAPRTGRRAPGFLGRLVPG
jgi:pilus assembly protein CpaE